MRILLRFSCGFTAAAALAVALLSGRWAVVLPLAAAALVLGGLGGILRFRAAGAGYVLLGLAVGLLWTVGLQTLESRHTLSPGEASEISGVATGYSTPTAYGIRVPAVVSDGADSARAMVWLHSEEAVKPGDAFTVTAVRKDAAEQSMSYRADGISLLVYGKRDAAVTPTERVPVRYAPRWIAHVLEQSLERSMPEETLGCAIALTTGNRDRLTSLERETFRTAGIYHLLALSGMHMAALTGMVSLLVRRRRRRALVCIPLCIAFTVVTGASASVVRAAVMQCLLLLAPLVKREEDTPTGMGVAAMLLTAQNPWCLFGWGMQLSFAATAGIYLFSGRLQRGLFRRLCGLGTVGRTVSASLASTASASVFTVPLMMVYYGRISLIAPLSNLLTGWAVTMCFQGCLLTALLGLLPGPLGGLLGRFIGWGIRYVQAAAALLSRVPFASLGTRSVYGAAWVVLTYGILLTTALSREKKRPVIPGCCAAVGLAACLLFTMLDQGGTSMTVLDVGQGQCLLFSCRGQTVMVDCGGSLGAGDVAANALLDVGEDRLDVLILTHYDADHVNGVPELLQRIRVERLLLPETKMDAQVRQELETAAHACGTKTVRIAEPERIDLAGGTVRLMPPAYDGDNACLGVLLDVEGMRALVTGDMDQLQERMLLREGFVADVDVLVAGHHGASTSTCQALLEAARPEIVVISVGSGNRYGHPAADTLARIAETGAAIYRTDQNGTIRLKGA